MQQSVHMSLTSPPATRPVPPLASQEVLGVPLALTDYTRTLDWIDAAVAAHQHAYVCVAAVHTVMESQEDPELREAVLASDFTVPDGQPLVWAMNLLGHNLSSRVYGPDLMERACERAARTGQTLLPLRRRASPRSRPCATSCRGAIPACASSARGPARSARSAPRRPRRSPPSSTPPSPTSSGSASACRCRRSGWRRCASRLDAPVLVGVGAAFDFHAGLKRQAPDSLQRLGLEWAFRLVRSRGGCGGATSATTRAS